jgi:hypothetical protein
MFTLNARISLTVETKKTYVGNKLRYDTTVLSLNTVKITEKAVQFSIPNTTYTLWFPKAAIKLSEMDIDDDIKYRFLSVASWFNFNDFGQWAVLNYGENISSIS